jgi:hypothetical protein
MRLKLLPLSVFIIFVVALTACNDSVTLNDPGASELEGTTEAACVENYTEKAAIRSLIQSFDVEPQPSAAKEALKSGCAASNMNLESFMTKFLCEIEASTSFNDDSDVQEDVDNLEYMDTSDLEGSCTDIEAL